MPGYAFTGRTATDIGDKTFYAVWKVDSNVQCNIKYMDGSNELLGDKIKNWNDFSKIEGMNTIHGKLVLPTTILNSRIDLNKLREIINNTPIISEIRKEFYITITQKRYEKIIQEPYEILLKQYNKHI